MRSLEGSSSVCLSPYKEAAQCLLQIDLHMAPGQPLVSTPFTQACTGVQLQCPSLAQKLSGCSSPDTSERLGGEWTAAHVFESPSAHTLCCRGTL